ncbi:MAG: amidohydrolase family protein [Candidatus Lokiarchaeota archaeon]|nr:amidohydrolase family protein [Candidatus Lokiarchaeota archaeon]
MRKLLIKNGLIFDPLNEISGEKKDILIEDGKIIDKFSSQEDLKEIDASGKTVIPAAIDIHAHIASQQVNWARLLGSKNQKFIETWNRLTLKNIAIDYIANGYTFIIDANVYPSLSKQTIFNFSNLPVLDKGMLLNVGNLWVLEDEFQRGKIEEISYFISDILSMCKGFGIKAYNPFEAESWNFKELRDNVEQGGRLYNFSSLEVYKNLTDAVENLKLPHSVHAHIEGYENIVGKNNLKKVLENIDFSNLVRENEKSITRDQIFHLAHANSYNIDGDNSELLSVINSNNAIDLDLGFIGFDDINPLITSDRRLINNHMKKDNGEAKVIRTAYETEGDSFVSFRKFDKKNKEHCMLWANCLELALKTENKWQIQLSFNFPHYSHVKNLPKIVSWLISVEARENFMKNMNNDFLNNTSLNEINNFLTFNDIVTITRASPAKSLGLAEMKGNFSLGADGDVNIIDIDLNEIDISKEYEKIEESLKNIEYVIKGGKIIKKNDKLDLESNGKIFWTEGKTNVDERKKYIEKKKQFYQKYYSTFYENLENIVDEKYLRKI